MCYFQCLFSDFYGFGEIEDTFHPAFVSQDSGIDVSVNPIDTEMPVQSQTQEKSCGQSQFTDSGFGDDATMSLTQNETATSEQRPSDILVTAECVPVDLSLNTVPPVQRTIEQQARTLQIEAEGNEMIERVSSAHV